MKIDIVVPIYNAYNALKLCLDNLQKCHQGVNSVYLIDDKSTDTRILSLIADYTKRNSWQLILNEINLGFVKTANKGLNLSDNHTVLLNSDTLVTQYWIKAFKQALQHNPNLGTATPWSNNAEICSFPNFLTNHPLPSNINQLAQVLYTQYQPKFPPLPTAVGFCMLISKKAKQVVGYFDEEHFGHGYGEENDYSLRVKAAGLDNILCDNAYVAHIGNQSFSDMNIQPSEETMQRLLQKHPDYLTMIQQYIEKDPLQDIRQEIVGLMVKQGVQL